MIDIEKVRNDAPACKSKLFFDSAGSSLMPNIIRNRINEYLREEEQYGGYKVYENRLGDLNEFYFNTAELINAQPRNVAFAHDATHAYAKALSSIPFNKGDTVLITDDDYVSNYINFISLQNRFGIEIKRVNNLENGDLDFDDFEQKIVQLEPKLVSVTHIPTNSGLIQDVQRVGELCKKYEVLYLLDACQSVGQRPIDVQRIGCDFMSVTGRKFLRGPRGTGFLYVSDKALEKGLAPIFIDLRGATWTNPMTYAMVDNATRFETWESPYALIIGFNEAIKYALKIGLENIYEQNNKLLDALRSNLHAIPKVTQFDNGSKLGSLVTFKKEGLSKTETMAYLNGHAVYFSPSTREAAVIDYDKKQVDWCIRLSPHYFNTLDEVDQLSDLIDSM